jgi:hypothetical protein
MLDLPKRAVFGDDRRAPAGKVSVASTKPPGTRRRRTTQTVRRRTAT